MDEKKSQEPFAQVAQPVTQPQVYQPYQQPRVVYGQPVAQAQPVNQGPGNYTVVKRRSQTEETYCGPLTLVLAFFAFFFIGPFVVFFFLCPCDPVPQQTVTREYRPQPSPNYA